MHGAANAIRTLGTTPINRCKTWWDDKRKASAEQDGCANPDCPVAGPEMWRCSRDYVHGKRDEDESKRKLEIQSVQMVGVQRRRSGNGSRVGQGMRFICRCCHASTT